VELPFLQYFNTWRHITDVQKLAFDLGHTASVLMDVQTVRLYQDALFWKRAGDGATPWHTDARMAPFDTSNMITFWIPLQPIPKKGGTALVFVPKSHCDFALPFWNDFETSEEFTKLEERYDCRTVDYMPLSLGDVTVHSGWTLHCADGNVSETDRLALAITYVDARAQVREDCLQQQSTEGGGYGDNEDFWSYKEWVEQVPARQQFRHELVPIAWPPDARD
jgi:ectoine hydroxylase-related dioxygenase (phytanoyl-CoA dioxygenase family)